MATRSPNACRKRAAAAGVSAISGTSISTRRPGVPNLGGQADVDLGLAAAGDAVQQGDAKLARVGQLAQPSERVDLLAGQLTVGWGQTRV